MRLINADWLLDVVENVIDWDTERDRNRIIHQVRELTPTVDVTPHWIPVTERPPKEGVDVLCKTLSGVKLVASYGSLNPWTGEKGWVTSELNRYSTSVLREWMPLPGEDRTEGSDNDHQ